MDRENVIKWLESLRTRLLDVAMQDRIFVLDASMVANAIDLLKEDCHNCKLECLLQKYDELKEKYDELLKEQEDLETELTNAVELIYKKNERIGKLLKEQGELIKHEYWRGYNNGRADERGLQEGTIMQTFSPD